MACIPNEKIKLEKATILDLRQIPGMDDATADSILRHVRERGSVKDFEELKAIQGLQGGTLDALKDCFYLEV